jgi:dipeptidyl aminopeptidase/acylaminoacyl peptidase
MKNCLWLLLICVGSPAFAERDPHTFANTDVFELEVATDPQIAPDGARIAYVRQSMDIMTDRARSNIWLVDADGDSHRPLLSGSSDFSSPRWSPGGDRIAYVSAVEGRGSQLYVRWMDTGQTALLTNLREAPSSIAWSPDGTRLAFSMFVPADERTLATPPEKPEGAEWAAPAKIIDRLYYRADGRGYLETGNTHIFVIPADGGTPRQLTEGDYEHTGPLSWSGDGESLVFSANRSEDYEYHPVESDLWRIDVATGALTRLTDRVGPDTAPTFSPDGSRLAYLGYDDRKMGYDNAGVYVMDVASGDTRALTEGFDRSISAVRWAGSSNRLYVSYEDRGRMLLATLDLQGEIEPVASDLGGTSVGRPYTSGSFSVADTGAYAYTAGTPYRPADIAAGRRGGGPRRLTALNDDLLDHKMLGAVEEMSYTSPVDGREIQGWLVKPPGFDSNATYPLLLEIHGGPFSAYGPNEFAAELQLYAAAGYVVLYTNPRGSTSYGFDFANEIHHAYPGRDYDDLMAGVDAALATGLIDSDRLYVTGGSGGGVLSAWIVGMTDRFRAAAVVKPVINWASTVLTTDIAAFMPEYWFASAPWEDPEEYWRRSPLSLVGNVTTPTLLMTGEQDHRTPIPESEQFYQALKLRKVDTALVRIPDASHGIASRPSQLIAKVDNILAWFEKYDEEE